MSYHLAPREGWVALRRSPYVLAIFNELPADLQGMATSEFTSIVASGFIGEAVKILEGSGWPSRNKLLASIEKLPINVKTTFAKALRERGLPVRVPGVDDEEFRPWR